MRQDNGRYRALRMNKIGQTGAYLKCLCTNTHSLGKKQEELGLCMRMQDSDTVVV